MHYVSLGINYGIKHNVISSFMVVLALTWIIYRLVKRIIRRCPCCGSIRYRRWHEREYQRPTGGGRGVAVSITHQMCLHKGCSLYLQDREIKAYEKEFPLAKMTRWSSSFFTRRGSNPAALFKFKDFCNLINSKTSSYTRKASIL